MPKYIAKKIFTGFIISVVVVQNVIQKRNLYHWFQRNNVSAYDINEYIKLYPNTSRRTGSLPVDWLKNLPRDKFAHVTEQVDTALHEFAQTVEEDQSIQALHQENELSERFTKLSKNLVIALQRILRRNDIKIKYVNQGGLKYCQKLTVGDYSYALSTFKPGKTILETSSTHGQYTEPQKSFWVYKISSHGRFAKPFMTRFCSQDDNGGYILSKFIDISDEKRAKEPINYYRQRYYPLTNEDNIEHKNEINGICFDCGGINENPEYKDIPDKEFWRNLLVFLDRMQANWDRYNKWAEKLLLKQIDDGKDIYSMDLRTLESDDPLDIRDAIRMVRRMRAVHKLKTKLEAEGKFEQYLQFIDYFNGHYNYLLRYEYDGWF